MKLSKASWDFQFWNDPASIKTVSVSKIVNDDGDIEISLTIGADMAVRQTIQALLRRFPVLHLVNGESCITARFDNLKTAEFILRQLGIEADTSNPYVNGTAE